MNVIDALDRRILDVLLTDSRILPKQLAEQIGLSSSSVSEHLRRLGECGMIRHYTVDIDPASLGYTLQAIVRVWPVPGRLRVVQQLIEGTSEIGERDKVAGGDCFIARLYVCSIDQPDEILDRVVYYAETNIVIVKV